MREFTAKDYNEILNRRAAILECLNKTGLVSDASLGNFRMMLELVNDSIVDMTVDLTNTIISITGCSVDDALIIPSAAPELFTSEMWDAATSYSKQMMKMEFEENVAISGRIEKSISDMMDNDDE